MIKYIIEELQAILNEHGDIDLVYYDKRKAESVKVTDVNVADVYYQKEKVAILDIDIDDIDYR